MWYQYSDTHKVNTFIKTYNEQPVMNIKLRDSMPIFDTLKNKLKIFLYTVMQVLLYI